MVTRVLALPDGRVTIRGLSHDNGEVKGVKVNGTAAELRPICGGITEWSITLKLAPGEAIAALAEDAAGNREQGLRQTASSGD